MRRKRKKKTYTNVAENKRKRLSTEMNWRFLWFVVWNCICSSFLKWLTIHQQNRDTEEFFVRIARTLRTNPHTWGSHEYRKRAIALITRKRWQFGCFDSNSLWIIQESRVEYELAQFYRITIFFSTASFSKESSEYQRKSLTIYSLYIHYKYI